MMRKSSIGLVIGVFLLAVAVHAQQKSSTHEWPQFRGPNGSGVGQTTGLPSEFGPDKNVIWKKTVPTGHLEKNSSHWSLLARTYTRPHFSHCL